MDNKELFLKDLNHIIFNLKRGEVAILDSTYEKIKIHKHNNFCHFTISKSDGTVYRSKHFDELYLLVKDAYKYFTMGPLYKMEIEKIKYKYMPYKFDFTIFSHN